MSFEPLDLSVTPEMLPLEVGEAGVIRVRGTRVTLDTLVVAFDEGATAEEISQRYPSVELADIYAVLAYVLRHEESVRDYLRLRERETDRVRSDNECRYDPSGIRARLLARGGRPE